MHIYENIRTLEVVTKRIVTERFAGNYRSSFHGSGIEVEDLRPYAEGDNARLIDWITTAKLGTPYVKKFRETRELSTFIIIDTSSSMRFGSIGGVRKQDRALETAAILLFSALRNGEATGAILFSDTVERVIPPRKGKRHALRILKEILDSYRDAGPKCGNLSPALARFNKLIKKHPICFVITDSGDWSDEVQRMLRITRLKNDLVYLHVEDPFEREITTSENIMLNDMERGGAMLCTLASQNVRDHYAQLRSRAARRRNDTLRRLRIDHTTIATDTQPYAVLLSLFKARQRNPRRA